MFVKDLSELPLVDYLVGDANLSDVAPEHQTYHSQQHRDALHLTQHLAPASNRFKHKIPPIINANTYLSSFF